MIVRSVGGKGLRYSEVADQDRGGGGGVGRSGSSCRVYHLKAQMATVRVGVEGKETTTGAQQLETRSSESRQGKKTGIKYFEAQNEEHYTFIIMLKGIFKDKNDADMVNLWVIEKRYSDLFNLDYKVYSFNYNFQLKKSGDESYSYLNGILLDKNTFDNKLGQEQFFVNLNN